MGTLQVSHGQPEPARQRAFHAFPPQCELELPAARQTVIAAAAALCAQSPRRTEQADWMRTPESHPGRVLAEAVRADRDWPPFPRAMRDGYALRAAEAAAAGKPLPCVGQVRAGALARALPPGVCLEIMTGAPVPAGADTVVMIERTWRGEDGIHFDAPPRRGDNIALPGNESAAGAVVAAAGRRLTPAVTAVLAQAGCLAPVVFAAPRVAIIATGDELTPPEQTPGPAQIRNSNGPMLAALARSVGAEVVYIAHVADDAAALRAAIADACAGAEAVICSGGASVGAHDLLKPVLDSLGAQLHFDAVAMRPGHPQIFARLGNQLLFGLPGNPLGALLGFLLLARPALDVLAGFDAAALSSPFITAAMDFGYHGKALPLVAFRPVRYAAAGAGTPHFKARLQEIPYRGSADVAAAAAADAWLMIPPGITELAAGSLVTVLATGVTA